MTFQIEKLIRSGESETVEFKQSTGEIKEILQTICAFANSHGGVILVGVGDQGDVVGVNIGKGTLESLVNTIQQQTDPKVFPSLNKIELEGKSILVLQVEESPIKPILIKGRGYRRVGRNNHILSSAEVANLSLFSRRMSWDAGPAENLSLEDVEPKALHEWLSLARRERSLDVNLDTPLEDILIKLDLLREGQLTRAAILLFGKEPQRFLRQSEVRVARFKGNNPLHFLDMKVIEGRIIDQREAIMDFIQRHIRMEATIEGLDRQERWEYPLPALREAVTNALCHRDYGDAGNVQVRIFDDRLEVWSPGTLPLGVTLESLRVSHNSMPRNRLVAYALFLVKYIEQWGTGTLRMMEDCKEAGLPEPEFTERGTAFVVSFYNKQLTRAHLESLGLSDRQIVAVEYARLQGRITNQEYVQLTKVSRRTATTELKKLEDMGLLTSQGGGRSLYYILSKRVGTGSNQ
ncbi:MAG: putative DNA binding domain-containing protein [Fimbriimonadia bacterium]|nr:putative DNA binding domain-containing protein [Fimbriimonadia bacterium]